MISIRLAKEKLCVSGDSFRACDAVLCVCALQGLFGDYSSLLFVGCITQEEEAE